MPNLLKKLKVTSVDLCKRGANQEAHIMLAKSQEGGESEVQYDKIGKAFAYAFGLDEDRDFFRQLTAMNKAMVESERSIKKSRLEGGEKDKLLEKSIGEYGEALLGLFKAKMPKEAPADEPDEEEAGDDEEEVDDEEEADEDEAGEPSGGDEAFDEEDEEDTGAEKLPPKRKGSNKKHPEVAKALTEVKRLRKALAMEQMRTVAARYECIGKKPDELAEKLYDLKKSSEENYNAYIALLDEIKKTVEDSGVFKELGTSRSGALGNDLNAAVAEVMKSDPKLTSAEAVVKAYELNPNLRETM